MSEITPGNKQEYKDLLERLRRNDASVNGVNMMDFSGDGSGSLFLGFFLPHRRSRPGKLAAALKRHTNITSLGLSLSYLLHNVPEHLMVECFAPLLYFIRTSPTLRNLRLFVEDLKFITNVPAAVDLSNPLLQAIAANAQIEAFECDVGPPCLSLPRLVLSTALHIKTFRLKFYDDDFDNQSRLALNAAFGAHQALEKLHLRWSGGYDTVTGILQELAANYAGKPKLSMILDAGTTNRRVSQPPPPPEHYSALEHLLATDRLKGLHLENYRFSTPPALRLFPALSASSSCRLFTIYNCTLNRPATLQFERYLQDIEGGDDIPAFGIGTEVEFEGETVGQVMARALSGSQLHLLYVSGDDHDELLTCLAANHSEIALPTLKLLSLSAAGARALSQFVSLSTRLKRLQVYDPLSDDVDCAGLFQAISQSGSLFDVEIEKIQSLYSARLAAVLERNICLQIVLNPSTRGNLGVAAKRRFPSLFRSAQQAPEMAFNNVFVGLLSDALAG